MKKAKVKAVGKGKAKEAGRKSSEMERKASEPAKVDAYIAKMKHPLTPVVKELRRIILSVDKEIGEEIKWNAPTYFYAGLMKPTDPKEYRRYIVVSNLFQKDCIRMVFPSGAKMGDKSGLLEGDYKDGRRLGMFYSVEDVRAKEKSLRAVIARWLELLEK